MDKNNAIPSEKLTTLRERAGLSMKALAQLMGYQNASSIQRYFSPSYDKPIPLNLIEKLIPALVGKGHPPIEQYEVLALGPGVITSLIAEPESAHTNEIRPLRILGEVAAGVWLEANVFEIECAETSNLRSGDGRFPIGSQYLLRIKGESLNKIAQNGDLILCINYLDANIKPKIGDLAVIERSRDGGMTIERTAKRITKHNGVVELTPESTDPRFQDPIRYNDTDPESSEVCIKAKILGSYKQFD
ncbi:S24 family peptidase [Breoghania sp. JC706]|uniref:S24 family peptidase n=1 Tax=Breoghania sp. JC706 TaxID=3117732 RepID=UPI003009050B